MHSALLYIVFPFNRQFRDLVVIMHWSKNDFPWDHPCIYYVLYSYFDKLLQVFGWSMWFAEYIFLERNWGRMKRHLKVFSTLPNNNTWDSNLMIIMLLNAVGVSKGWRTWSDLGISNYFVSFSSFAQLIIW